MTDARQQFLSEARERDVAAEWVAALERVPAHFFATAAAVAEGTDHAAVLAALRELLEASAAHEQRRADAAEAQLAERRRSSLTLVPLPAAETHHNERTASE